MFNFIIRFIVNLLVIIGIAILIPTVAVFFLQVLIIGGVLFVIISILCLFYKGDTDVV
jgi:accessory gene regulator protein AgrB